MYLRLFLGLIVLFIFSACQQEELDSDMPTLRVRLAVDPDQIRLGNRGEVVDIPAAHGAVNPVFNALSAHYLELAPTAFTALGAGEVVYQAPETTRGGNNAIDFSQSIIVEPGGVFLEVPLNTLQNDSYEWVRLSLSYQNFDLPFTFNGTDRSGSFASFVGFNTYLETVSLKGKTVPVNDNRPQGFWAFATADIIKTGQAPAGATTVPNPLFNTSPIPQGSCIVTGQFAEPLTITGNETTDIEVVLSLSVNKSFEWVDDNQNGKWDITSSGVEQVVDMGLRGLVPSWR